MVWKTLLILSVLFCLREPTAFGQTSLEDRAGQQLDNTRRSKKNRQKLKKHGKKKAEEKLTDEVVESIKNAFFPDWPTQSFDFSLSPIVGLKYSQVTQEDQTFRTTTVEGGVKGSLTGIAPVPGNPGLSFSPYAGYAKGTTATVITSIKNAETDTVAYDRYYLGLDTKVYVRFYRHTLDLSLGKKSFNKESYDPIQSAKITNDFGVLVLPWISTHFTHTYLNGYSEKMAEPFLSQMDNWLHTRVFTDFLDFYFDVGPGFTVAKEYAFVPEHTQIAVGQTDYIKAFTSLHLFWKIAMSGSAKYVVRANSKDLGQYATTKLPDEAVDDPPNTTMPEDSIFSSIFFGIDNIAYGIGFGWRYNIQVLNVSKRDNKPRETTRDHGVGLTFSMNL
jgi:hypothetical protein